MSATVTINGTVLTREILAAHGADSIAAMIPGTGPTDPAEFDVEADAQALAARCAAWFPTDHVSIVASDDLTDAYGVRCPVCGAGATFPCLPSTLARLYNDERGRRTHSARTLEARHRAAGVPVP